MNIYVFSSSRGPSGIAILRLSGKDTLKICKEITNHSSKAQFLSRPSIYFVK
jgi:tRNA U34 5-carboxymethylaminomethyl modifying GTPase MnmE/TrmE